MCALRVYKHKKVLGSNRMISVTILHICDMFIACIFTVILYLRIFEKNEFLFKTEKMH